MNYNRRMSVQLAPLRIHWKEQTEVEEHLRRDGFEILDRLHITLRWFEPDDGLTQHLAASLEKIATRRHRLTLKILGLEMFKDKGIAYLRIEKTRELKALRTDIVNMTTRSPWASVVMDWQWTPHISIARVKSNTQLEQWKRLPRQAGEVVAEWLEFLDWDGLDKQYRLATY
jgi:2'-5' RNA ligase